MTDELELLRSHFDAMVERPADVDEIRSRLRQAIADEASSSESGFSSRLRWRTVSHGHRCQIALGTLVVAGIAALVVALVVTASTPLVHRGALAKGHGTTALSPGEQLRLIADRVAEVPVPRLRDDQLLLTQSQLAVHATVNNGQSQATIELTVEKWSNATGQSCTLITAQPAQFASAADRAAWSGLGLLYLPSPQPITGCLGEAQQPDSITGNGSLLDVSTLPVDPSALAQELEDGTTGLASVDDLPADSANPNIAFQRAAVLLVGPTVGATRQFNAALFKAIALLPGVIGLGSTTTHDRSNGQGFATESQDGQSAIVVDANTGQLLEVRNIEDSSALSSIASNYLGPGQQQVTSYGADLLWLDPLGEPTVIQASDIPAGVPLAIFATAKSGVVESQIFTLENQLEKQFGHPSGGRSFSFADPTLAGSQTTLQFDFAGPGQQFDNYLKAIRASGLIASINII